MGYGRLIIQITTSHISNFMSRLNSYYLMLLINRIKTWHKYLWPHITRHELRLAIKFELRLVVRTNCSCDHCPHQTGEKLVNEPFHAQRIITSRLPPTGSITVTTKFLTQTTGEDIFLKCHDLKAGKLQILVR